MSGFGFLCLCVKIFLFCITMKISTELFQFITLEFWDNLLSELFVKP